MSLLGLGDARSRATLLLLGGLTIGSLALLQILPIHNRLALYTAALSAFHALEYLMTALYHPTAVSFECTQSIHCAMSPATKTAF